MKYEKTKIKKTDPKKVIIYDMQNLSTFSIIWFVLKRHKVGILFIWAVSITLLYLFPTLPTIIGAVLFNA